MLGPRRLIAGCRSWCVVSANSVQRFCLRVPQACVSYFLCVSSRFTGVSGSSDSAIGPFPFWALDFEFRGRG